VQLIHDAIVRRFDKPDSDGHIGINANVTVLTFLYDALDKLNTGALTADEYL